MNKKQLNKIIIFWTSICVLFFSVITYKCAQYKFLKTTGFYFSGLTYDEIGDIQAFGFDKKQELVRYIYCFQHYRLTEDYIFNNWRFDFVYYDFVDSIILKVPDILLPKIEKVWYKYDKTVTVFSGGDFINTWPHKKEGKNTCFFIPEKLKQKNSFYDGFLCIIYKKGPLFRFYRYAMLISFITFMVLVFIRFYSFIKKIFVLLFKAANYIRLKYRGFFRRLFAFFLGLLFLFLILETTLRVVGYVHNAKNIERQYMRNVSSKDLIICVGDSFTESFGSSEGNDYPSQFERIINKHLKSPVEVLNFGRSGKNTAQILLEMPIYVKNYKPRLIVLMAGSANYWNYWGYKEKESVFYKLRTLNFFRLLIQGIRDRRSNDMFDPIAYINRRNNCIDSLDKIDTLSSPLLKLIRIKNYPAINNYADSCLRSGLLNDNDMADLLIFYKLTASNDTLKNILQKVKTNSFFTKFYFLLSGFSSEKECSALLHYLPYYQSVYYYLEEMKAEKFSEARIKECIVLNPYFEDPYFQYYSMGHKNISIPDDFEQKRFSIIDTMNYYKALLGVGAINSVFQHAYIDESIEEKYERKKIDSWVSEDIENIISLCQQNGVPVVLMNYPLKNEQNVFSSVNEVLRKTALENDVLFVDNGLIFNAIVKDRNSYFISDGHCSDKGYELIAQNLYKILKDNKMFDE